MREPDEAEVNDTHKKVNVLRRDEKLVTARQQKWVAMNHQISL